MSCESKPATMAQKSGPASYEVRFLAGAKLVSSSFFFPSLLHVVFSSLPIIELIDYHIIYFLYFSSLCFVDHFVMRAAATALGFQDPKQRECTQATNDQPPCVGEDINPATPMLVEDLD